MKETQDGYEGEEREAGLPEKGGGIRWEEGSIDVLGLFQKKKDYAYKNFRVVQDKGEMHVIGVVMGDYVLALLPTRMSAQISIPPIRLFIHQQVVMQQVSCSGDRNARVVLPKRRKAQSSNRIKPNYVECYDRLNKTQGVQEIFQAAIESVVVGVLLSK